MKNSNSGPRTLGILVGYVYRVFREVWAIRELAALYTPEEEPITIEILGPAVTHLECLRAEKI